MENLILSNKSREEFLETLDKLIEVALDFKLRDKIINYSSPQDLSKILKNMNIEPEGKNFQTLIEDFYTISHYSLNWSSKNFLAHQDSGNSIAGILGDIGTTFLQQNTVSFDSSRIATTLEIKLLQFLRKLVGYEYFEDYLDTLKAGGAFTFGGYGSNLSGLLIAREKLKSKLSKKGKIFEPRKSKILASKSFAHYSLNRATDILGLGNKDLNNKQLLENNLERDAVVNIDTHNYKMNIYELEKTINIIREKNEEILSIFAVAGESRALGFDNITEIVKLAEKYDLWVHLDACMGCQCLFSSKLKSTLLKDVEKVDSISFDPHKVLMVPYNLSLFLLKDYNNLSLLPQGPSIINTSLGTYTPGIGSKAFISLKLWFVLRNWGLNKLEEEINRRHELAIKTAELINCNNDLILLNPEIQHNAVVFMYKPKIPLLSINKLNFINQEIREKITENGKFFLHTFSTIDDCAIISKNKSEELTPLRILSGNPLTTIENIKSCLEEVCNIGEKIIQEYIY